MTTYLQPTDDVMDVVETTLNDHHKRLKSIGINIAVLLVMSDLDRHGEPTGNALKLHGIPAYATTRVLPLKLRAHGLADVEILIDGDRWGDLLEEERSALIDHELTHLEPVEKDGVLVTDDLQRPKFKMRHHDFNFGWFAEVVARHKSHSIEHRQARDFVKSAGQLFLDLEVN